jgi:hypothetical protein
MNMALRPAVVLLLGLLGAVPSACAGRLGSPTEPRGEVAFTTLLQTGVPGQSGGEIRVVVRDRAAWVQLWAQLRQESSLPEAPPEVDFGKDMVIVAAMATQPCVSKVTVRAITRAPGGLRVDLLEEPPAANCRCIVSQRPIHAVRLPRSDASVEFTATTTPRAC